MVKRSYIALWTGCAIVALCWVHIALVFTGVLHAGTRLADPNVFGIWLLVLLLANWPQLWLTAHFYYRVSRRMAVKAGAVWLAMVLTFMYIVLALGAVT